GRRPSRSPQPDRRAVDLAAGDRAGLGGHLHPRHLHRLGDSHRRRGLDRRAHRLVLAQAPPPPATPGAAVNEPERDTTIDVSGLPTFALGARTPMFWGVVLLMAIETTMLA